MRYEIIVWVAGLKKLGLTQIYRADAKNQKEFLKNLFEEFPKAKIDRNSLKRSAKK